VSLPSPPPLSLSLSLSFYLNSSEISVGAYEALRYAVMRMKRDAACRRWWRRVLGLDRGVTPRNYTPRASRVARSSAGRSFVRAIGRQTVRHTLSLSLSLSCAHIRGAPAFVMSCISVSHVREIAGPVGRDGARQQRSRGPKRSKRRGSLLSSTFVGVHPAAPRRRRDVSSLPFLHPSVSNARSPRAQEPVESRPASEIQFFRWKSEEERERERERLKARGIGWVISFYRICSREIVSSYIIMMISRSIFIPDPPSLSLSLSLSRSLSLSLSVCLSY